MQRVVLALLGLGLAAASVAAQPHSPYAASAHHPIKALSPAEIDDLRAGRGMGLAKPAELNGYPGPMHVLELAAQLGLNADQRAASEAIIQRMRAAAIALGARIIAAEHDLDRAFASGQIDIASMRTQTAGIATLYGRLRAVHLDAHLEQRAVLTPEQARRYMELRGYANAPMGHGHSH